MARMEKLRCWSRAVENPMHVVLTQKNFKTVTPALLKSNVEHLAKVRRLKVFEQVKGGCVSVEMTNSIVEGWHLHSHWLVNARFIDMKQLAIDWGKLVGQHFAIVHFNNSKEKSFLEEVCKYVCKPSEMVNWTAAELIDFIESARGRRFFFTFGDLFHKGKEIREFLAQSTGKQGCQCSQCASPAVRITSNKWCAENAKRRAIALAKRFAEPLRPL
jgi:hypothetical protein